VKSPRVTPGTVDQPLRLPIQDIYKFDQRRILAGRIESGILRVGDRLLFSPSNRTARVKSIEVWSSDTDCLEARAGQSVALTLDERRVGLTGGDIDLTAAVVPTTFPDYERFLVPADDVTRVQTDRRRLLAALEGFDGVDGADGETTVVLATSATGLRIGSDDQTVEIEARCDGAERRVALNARFVVDAIRDAVGAEIVIDIEDPLSSVLFRSADDGTFTSLVMPIKPG